MFSTDGGQAQTNLPHLNVLAQYTKNFSFSSPNAPRSLAPTQEPPGINIQINVRGEPFNDTDIEVELKIMGKAETTGTLLFSFDLTYAGVFRVYNIPDEDVHPVIMIEAPRLLFPFAREIISTAVRNGGFPPLLIDQPDFVALYREKMNELQRQSS